MTTSTVFRRQSFLFEATASAEVTLSRAAEAITSTDDTITVLERAAVALLAVETIIERVARDARTGGGRPGRRSATPLGCLGRRLRSDSGHKKNGSKASGLAPRP